MSRLYICHTYYHAYVSLVRELNMGKEHFGEAVLVLSTMSNNFESLKERAIKSGVFRAVYMYDEQPDTASDEVMKYHRDRGNQILNLLQRIKYTKLLGKLQEQYFPVELKDYEDVYLFCDSDPAGYYLNYKKKAYHAMEDGINSVLLDDQARNSNKGAFGLKCFMAKLGLIFIENGYSRYCIDFIVNDLKANPNPPSNIKQESFNDMCDRLSEEDHRIIVGVFLDNPEPVLKTLDSTAYDQKLVMILTEPLCELEVRRRMFGDLISRYQNDFKVIIKPHPRDNLDYEKEFPDTVVIRERFPMEVLNDIPSLRVSYLVSVITQVNGIRFADEIEYLGLDFLDEYEEPSVHRQDMR